jgi:hypothetical protein
MRISKREVRAQIAHRDPRQVCPRRRYLRVRHHHCRRAVQNARRDLRPVCRRANDSQIVRDQIHAYHLMDEKPPAKMSPVPTTRAPPKLIHQEAVPIQRPQPESYHH